ncbi:MAG: M20/M25/M40 family metallo-hydrolase, partial [Oscillospiraceae bacterium]|nr:M20/M25/M40 family metallo-hydrolase [Oscillospiraceae bacterium]
FALKALKDLNIPMKSGIRFIFGTNEENGSEDLAYYMKHRTLPPMVFTPDGDYPVINLEKGMIRLKLSANFTDGKSKIMHLQAGDVINAVPAKAEAVAEQFHDTITMEGRNAHASTPEQGENALTKLLHLLKNTFLLPECQQTDIIRKLAKCFPHGETDGKSCGIAAKDDLSGSLTCVLSVMKMNETEMTAYVDIRFPVCCTGAEIIQKMQEALSPIKCEALICDEPHHTDKNSKFVQTLLKVYENVTGLKGECLAIGGGTYVHHIEGGVAFGATFPDTDVHMHGAEEFIKLKHFMLDAEMMALAMTELCADS